MKPIMLGLLLLTTGCKPDNRPVINSEIEYIFPFELEKYLGVWYEIARFDHSFERGLQGVTATYSVRDDGKIKVVNQGYKTVEGKPEIAVGKAKIPDQDDPRRLKVSFFLFFYADYFILELDPQYQYAVIGSKSPGYLWILSRTPIMDVDLLDNLIERIKKRGYNTEKLIWVDHHTTNME
jgi:apolipoprotein D and lipocalin family protein